MNICFAFNKSGLRCMEPAEHDGPHSHSIEWTDDECWTPATEQVKAMPSRAMGVADGLVPPTPKARPCEICEHPMHQTMCPVGACDCRMGV